MVQNLQQVPKARVEEFLGEILSDSAYRKVSPDSTEAQAKIAGAMEELTQWFENLFDFMPYSSANALLVVTSLLLALLGTAYFGYHLYHRDRRYYREDGPAQGLTSPGSLGLKLESARVQAVEDGAFTEALSLRFRLGLLAIAQHSPGQLRPGFTNRECLVVYSREPDYRARLAAVIDLLDSKWYAQEECSPEEYNSAETVLAEMGQHAF
ncbi:MAG: hypothetical protein ACI84E_001762 [Planctomycetota bacterium]|jgi:hypothetical protein